MGKRILSLLLVLMILPLAACGDGDGVEDYVGSDVADVGGSETDSDSDVPDDGVPRKQYYRVASYEMISDGNATEILKYGYNNKGQLTYIRWDEETDPIATMSYGADGIVSELLNYSDGSLRQKQNFENGNLVYSARYLVGGTEPISAEGWEYDEAGRIISEFGYDSDGNIGDKLDYAYSVDSNGRETEAYAVADGEKYLMRSYEYDEDGNCVRENYYDPYTGALTDIKASEYDSNGNVTSSTEYYVFQDSNGEDMLRFSNQSEYTYDEEGNLLTEKVYNEDEEHDSEKFLSVTRTNTYSDGKLILTEHMAPETGLVGKEEYEYDENGNLVLYRRTSYSEIDVVLEKKYTYREFMLTAEEIALAQKNDAILEDWSSY